MRVISTNGSARYHTTADCPFYPDEWREVEDADLRRSVRKCHYCRSLELDV